MSNKLNGLLGMEAPIRATLALLDHQQRLLDAVLLEGAVLDEQVVCGVADLKRLVEGRLTCAYQAAVAERKQGAAADRAFAFN